jgi:hypothetical protein
MGTMQRPHFVPAAEAPTGVGQLNRTMLHGWLDSVLDMYHAHMLSTSEAITECARVMKDYADDNPPSE